jgi:hypothetical protein
MRPSAAAFGLALGLATITSCLVGSFDVAPSGAGSGGRGDGGSSQSGAGGDDDPCGHATYPLPPGTTTEGTDEVVVALRRVAFGEDSPTPPGLDLDDTCTCCCQGEGPSCLQPKTSCDYPEGVDNAVAGLFQLFDIGLVGFGSEEFSQNAEQGQWSVLLRVRDYNGSGDDDRVELSWLVGLGIFGGLGERLAPQWDGEDAWTVATSSFTALDGGPADPALGLEGNLPRYVDTKAYVTDHKLVASLPDTELLLGSGPNRITFHLVGAFVVGELAQAADGTGLALTNALLVGQWRLGDFFDALSTYRNADGTPFCTDDSLYKVIKPTICGAVDMYSGTATPTTPCDAFSLGMAFEASSAKLVGVADGSAPTPGCPLATDPAGDSCTAP